MGWPMPAMLLENICTIQPARPWAAYFRSCTEEKDTMKMAWVECIFTHPGGWIIKSLISPGAITLNTGVEWACLLTVLAGAYRVPMEKQPLTERRKKPADTAHR